jgi:16S rRNA (cytosine967-C5)-methyltransferase
MYRHAFKDIRRRRHQGNPLASRRHALCGAFMTPGARLSAAIEVMADIEARRRPATDALKDWGLAHRFAGSGDRAAIAGLVYDALRRKASAAFVMDAETPRAILLGMLRLERKLDAAAVGRLADGGRFAPEPLSDAERNRLAAADLTGAPAWVTGDYPEWLDPHLARSFGDERAAEGAALAARAPLDLRVNTLKGTREEAQAALSDLHPTPTRWSPVGLRIVLAAEAKSPAIHAEPAFIDGLIEVQDEGSQLAALFAGAKPGEQVIDLCAGAGGKTLALAAAMENRGQLHATDDDKRRLAPIHARIERAGVRNVQVHTPRSDSDVMAGLAGRADLVLIDAPCTGTGTWRRNPDAKWRMRPGALEIRMKAQTEVLDRAAALVRPGGRIAYVTCSVLGEENGDAVRGFLARHPDFAVVPPAEVAGGLGERAFLFRRAVLMSDEGLLMTPRRTDTDGFFVAMMARR